MRPRSRNALSLLGAVVGLALWALAVLGLAELGVLSGFDPFGVMEEPPPRTLAVDVAEWSYPICGVLGAVLLPELVAWLTRPSAAAHGR